MAYSTTLEARPLSPETIIASVLLSPNVSRKLTMSQVAKLILNLEDKGVDTSRMLCYPTATSAYCEDLDRFVSKLVSFGYASDSSPIKLNNEGERICREIIEEARQKENKGQIEKLESALKTTRIKE